MGNMARKSNKETTFEDKLPLAISTGKVLFGFRQCMKSLESKECKMIVITSNLPPLKKKQLEYYAFLNKDIPVYPFVGNNKELARSCAKYHRCGAIAIINDGEADLIPKEVK